MIVLMRWFFWQEMGENDLKGGPLHVFLPSSALTDLNSTSTSIEAEIALFPISDTHSPTWTPTHPHVKVPPQRQCQQYISCYWNDFDQTFKIGLGPSWTDFNCYNDICSGNIYPGDICPYQEYLSWNWPDYRNLSFILYKHELFQIVVCHLKINKMVD